MINLEVLKNTKIDKIIAGGSNGSIVLMDLIENNKKYTLYIYCAWRLSLKKKVLTGWNDDSIANNSVFVSELKKMEGELIKKIDRGFLGDFALILESGKRLDIFCDITSNGDNDDLKENWTICNISENICYNFTNNFHFIEEPYN